MAALVPGSSLGPYTVREQLGSGGMGEVYLADDPRLSRRVAIKILSPSLTSDDTAKQRFLQEAQAASALDHPNICTIFDVGETDDGQLDLVMAHYEGETLADRLQAGPIGVAEAVELVSQVGRGLGEAHRAGVVHRDIKPANLLLTSGGTVKILDFGLAKLMGSEGATQIGTMLGTVAYMSPEQARGEGVDHRTDIWALGVVLYEMLAGRRPFEGENLLAISGAIQDARPAPLGGEAASLSGVVVRALSKKRTERPQQASDFVEELGAALGPGASTVASADAGSSIAVLPFADMSAAKDQDYFCEGMAEEIINALTKLDGLKVASRTSSFQFKGESDDIRAIGDALGVTTVLEGSVRTAGTRLRVTAQLINIADGYHLWSERYDRTMEDVFDIQDEIAAAITEALKVELVGGTPAPAVERFTDDLDAYHLYLQGRHQWLNRPDGWLAKATRCYEEATEKDPDYPLAHAGTAQLDVIRGVYGMLPPKVAFPQARRACELALAKGPDVAEVHATSGMIETTFDWDWEASERSHTKAIALDATDPLPLLWRGVLFACTGRQAKAEADAAAALALDPLTSYTRTIAASSKSLGKTVQGVEMLRTTLEADPDYMLAHFLAAMGYGGLSMHQQAIGHAQQADRLAGHLPFTAGQLGQAYARAGQTTEAKAVLDELKKRSEREYVPMVALAFIAAALGAMDDALDWLEQEHRDRGVLLWMMGASPLFAEFRGEARFQALLRQMGLGGPVLEEKNG